MYLQKLRKSTKFKSSFHLQNHFRLLFNRIDFSAHYQDNVFNLIEINNTFWRLASIAITIINFEMYF